MSKLIFKVTAHSFGKVFKCFFLFLKHAFWHVRISAIFPDSKVNPLDRFCQR